MVSYRLHWKYAVPLSLLNDGSCHILQSVNESTQKPRQKLSWMWNAMLLPSSSNQRLGIRTIVISNPSTNEMDTATLRETLQMLMWLVLARRPKKSWGPWAGGLVDRGKPRGRESWRVIKFICWIDWISSGLLMLVLVRFRNNYSSFVFIISLSLCALISSDRAREMDEVV